MLGEKAGRCEGCGESQMVFNGGTWGTLAKHEAGKAITSQIVKGLSCHAEKLIFYPVQQYQLIVLPVLTDSVFSHALINLHLGFGTVFI